jgi:ribonuclease HI
MEQYVLRFDGSCNPNPGGTAAYGFTISKDGETVKSGHGVIGKGKGMTNNLAEFWALKEGLECFQNEFHPWPYNLNVIGDSNLVIKIMRGKWRASFKKPYFNAYLHADILRQGLENKGVTMHFNWVPREHNQECDNLSKKY